MSILDSVEIRFLLEDVMQVKVLTYMEEFKHIQVGDLLDEVEKQVEIYSEELPLFEHAASAGGAKIVKGKIKSPSFHKQKWSKTVKKTAPGLTAPTNLKGKQQPESIAAVISESLAASNPALHSLAFFSSEISRLIEELGNRKVVDTFCPRINSGSWSATLSISESPLKAFAGQTRTLATLKDDAYLIEGTKVMIPAGEHDLTSNTVHLVVAKLAGSPKKEEIRGLFLVPKFNLVEGKLVDNHFQLEKIHPIPGNQSVPYCCISYGKSGETRGTLLAILEEKGPKYLQGIHHQFGLQVVGILSAALNRISLAKEIGLLELDDPYTRNRFMEIQAMLSGLRGGIYSSAFYLDCLRHGGEQQKSTFENLADLQIQIMKVYASHKGKDIIDKCIQMIGIEAFSDDYTFGQHQQDLSVISLLGATSEQISKDIYQQVLQTDSGESFQGLLNELQGRDMSQAKTDSLHEAIGIWRDYLGGAIVLIDEIANSDEENQKRFETEKVHLFPEKLLLLIGDLIVGYHLIIQGIEAEKQLVKLEANFFNLQQEAIGDPGLRRWFNKTLLAEFFAVNILSQQEGQIPIIQRNSQVALEAL